jgi:orotidine-5'-phosphate decarboxylase
MISQNQMIIDKYNQRAKKVNSLLCVGLDSDFEKLPTKFKKMTNPQFEFNKWIIKETNQYAAAFKLNVAFYEARGDKGITELKKTMEYLQKNYPDIFLLCDCKRADIGNTNKGYVDSLFDWFGFDAITLHPYLGQEALKPFLQRKDKGCIILCRTSNPGAGEFQDLKIGKKPLWQIVAEAVSKKWNKNKNCLLVVGATYPEEMKKIRNLVGDMTFLVPGVGAQGGDLKASMKAGLNSKRLGLIIHSARGIIFAENPKEEARKLCEEIRKYSSVV